MDVWAKIYDDSKLRKRCWLLYLEKFHVFSSKMTCNVWAQTRLSSKINLWSLMLARNRLPKYNFETWITQKNQVLKNVWSCKIGENSRDNL